MDETIAGLYRVALFEDCDARDPLDEKDSIGFNVFFEKTNDSIHAIKRAGTSLYLTRTGGAMGLFVYEDNLYSWTLTDNPLDPEITPL
jgi:hypothetical protein